MLSAGAKPLPRMRLFCFQKNRFRSATSSPPDVGKVYGLPVIQIYFSGLRPDSFIRGIAPSEIETEVGRLKSFRASGGKAAQRV